MDWFIAVWPDGEWCDWRARHWMKHRSDDFYRARVLAFDEGTPLLTAPAPLAIYVSAAGVARFSL